MIEKLKHRTLFKWTISPMQSLSKKFIYLEKNNQ